MFDFSDGKYTHMPFVAYDGDGSQQELCCINVGGLWKLHWRRSRKWWRIRTGLPDDATECLPAAEWEAGMWKVSFVAGGWRGDRRFRLYWMYEMDSAPMAQGVADVGFVRKNTVAMAGRRGPITIRDMERTVTLDILDAMLLYRPSYAPQRPNRLLLSGETHNGELFSWSYALPERGNFCLWRTTGRPPTNAPSGTACANRKEDRGPRGAQDRPRGTPRVHSARRGCVHCRDHRILEEHSRPRGVRMSCSCHGQGGVSVMRTSPYDQCTACAKKHIAKGWSLFNEFTYTDDNRNAMTGQLRLAVAHLIFDYPDTARLARNLAVMLEENCDAKISNRWEALLAAVRKDYNDEHPDAAALIMGMAKQKEESVT